MHEFSYRQGALHAEEVSLAAIAQAVGTPFYCYATATITREYQVFAQAFADVPSRICYAVKANSNQAVIATLARLVRGPTSSLGRAQTRPAGRHPARTSCFRAWARRATNSRRRSTPELFCINVDPSRAGAPRSLATAKARTPRSAPGQSGYRRQDACQDRDRASGKQVWYSAQSARDVYARAARLTGVRVAGVDMHIGSQITDCGPLTRPSSSWPDLVRTLRSDGHRIEHLDVGGGLGIPIGTVTTRRTRWRTPGGQGRHARPRCTLLFEPGRVMVGNAGVLIDARLYLKPPARRRISWSSMPG